MKEAKMIKKSGKKLAKLTFESIEKSRFSVGKKDSIDKIR